MSESGAELEGTLAELAARVGLEPLLMIPELAALAKVSRRTVERAIAEGRLHVVHLSPRAVRIPRSSAAAYLAGDGSGFGPEGATIQAFPDHLTEGGRRD